MNTPKYIIVHHSGGTDLNPLQDSSNYTFKDCDYDHRIRFNMKSKLGYYVGYHYFIDKYGVLRQAREDNEEGAHTIGYNTSSLGICLAGNFDATLPTKAQIDTLTNLLKQKSAQYSIPLSNIVPHRKFAQKTCFGKLLPDSWARDLLKGDTITPLVQSLSDQIGKKDYKRARDSASLLFTELSKLI